MKLRAIGLVFSLVALAVAVGASSAEPSIGFGGGGPSFGWFFADLAEVSAFAENLGFPDLEGNPWLAGGQGHGGVLGGIAAGGCGWGAWIDSLDDDRETQYAVGWGGMSLGFALGGNERSILTVGAVLGAGGGGLKLIEETSTNGTPVPLGIVIEPTTIAYGAFFLVAAPYIDMHVMLSDWIGIAVRAKYMVAPFQFTWIETSEEESSLPRLAPSGLAVSFSLVFGGIGPNMSVSVD